MRCSCQSKHWQLGFVMQFLHRVLEIEKSASDNRFESPPGVVESYEITSILLTPSLKKSQKCM